MLIVQRAITLSPMDLTLRWVSESDLDRVAETRMKCYGHASKDLPGYKELLARDPRSAAGDFLLAEDGPEAVGTATAISFTTWIRGTPLPCQGVAWVGTIRTRRRGGSRIGAGIASQLMHETIRNARDREQVISALMPFRASFYEHFGYGIVERRCEWTLPLSILPRGSFEGIRFARESDRPEIRACHQRSVERGQCDMERSAARWSHLVDHTYPEGFEVVDRPSDADPVRSQIVYSQFSRDAKDLLKVQSLCFDDWADFKRQLHFLASMKDQYHAVQLTLPADLPLNQILTERQIPHRLVNHATPEARPFTRMAARILDHARLLESIRIPSPVNGKAVISVRETEGHTSTFRLECEAGQFRVSQSTATPDIDCPDTIWAAIALGDLSASRAAQIGLIETRNSSAISWLDTLSAGPAPFCEEYF